MQLLYRPVLVYFVFSFLFGFFSKGKVRLFPCASHATVSSVWLGSPPWLNSCVWPGSRPGCLVIIRISAECPLRDNTIHCIPLLPHLRSSPYRTDIFAEASCYLSLAIKSRRIICIAGIWKDFTPHFQIFKILLRRMNNGNGHIKSGCSTFVKAPTLKLYLDKSISWQVYKINEKHKFHKI